MARRSVAASLFYNHRYCSEQPIEHNNRANANAAINLKSKGDLAILGIAGQRI
jgi:hypothetical protein